MRIDVATEVAVKVAISKRNLLALLHKVDDEESQRTISIFNGETVLIVVAEPDEEHYGHREFPAGKMTPETEEFITAGRF